MEVRVEYKESEKESEKIFMNVEKFDIDEIGFYRIEYDYGKEKTIMRINPDCIRNIALYA